MIQLWLVFTELPDRQTQPNNIEDNNERINVTLTDNTQHLYDIMSYCHLSNKTELLILRIWKFDIHLVLVVSHDYKI